MNTTFKDAEGGTFLLLIETGEIILKFGDKTANDRTHAVFCSGAKKGMRAFFCGTVAVSVMNALFSAPPETNRSRMPLAQT
jgi:hypothetical protein